MRIYGGGGAAAAAAVADVGGAREEARVAGERLATAILYKNTDGRFVASNTPTADSLSPSLFILASSDSSSSTPNGRHRLHASLLLSLSPHFLYLAAATRSGLRESNTLEAHAFKAKDDIAPSPVARNDEFSRLDRRKNGRRKGGMKKEESRERVEDEVVEAAASNGNRSRPALNYSRY